jgi:RHS repeat-associated protein
VYNSDTVNARPIITATLASDPQGPVPVQLQVRLTWNGQQQPWVSFGTNGHHPGDVYLLPVQVANPVANSGLYPWMVQIQAILPGNQVVSQVVAGTSAVVVNGPASPFGAGWSLAGLNQLVPVNSGVLWVSGGTGGSRYFSALGGGSFLSPPNDFGTLVQYGNSYTYTAKDQARFLYDASGRLVQVVDPHNLAASFRYNGNQLANVFEPDGGVTTFNYSLGHVSSILEPGNRVLTFTYNAAGDLTGITAPDGNQRTFTYDSFHHLTNDRWLPLNASYSYGAATGVLNRIDLGLGSTLGIVPVVARGLGSGTAASAGQAVATLTDALNRVTTYTLDALGRETMLQTPDGAVQRWTRDFAGQVTSAVDALNHTTSYIYQYGPGLGDLVQVNYADGSTFRYQYDPIFHHVTQSRDSLNHLTTYSTNSQGDLIATRNALGQVTAQVWSNGLLQSVTNPLGHTTSYQYDSARRLQVLTNALGNQTVYSYDGAGNLVSVQDAMGRLITNTYDGMRRLVQQVDATGGVTLWRYNALGEITSQTDPLGQTTTSVYDGQGRLIQTIDAQGGATIFGYDAVGNRVSLTDPLGNQTLFQYDARHRRIQETDPLNHSAAWAYDPAGRLVSTTDRDGRQRTFAYDNVNRLVQETWVAVDGTTVDTLSYTYDADGNLLTAADSNGRYMFTYDALERPMTEQEPFGLTLAFGYDSAGNRTTVQDSLGGVTTSIYDAVHNLSSRQFEGAGLRLLRVDLTYTPRQELATVTRYRDLGVSQLVGSSVTIYDANSRLVNLQHQDGSGTILSNFAYSYDAADRLTSETYSGNAVTTSSTLTTSPASYTYDVTNQLIGDGRNTYSYDANGNRMNYQTGPNNQLLDDGTWAYTYDNEGNLVQKTNHATGETWTYGYDHANRMVWAEDRASNGGNLLQRVSFKVDVFGNRIEKDVWTAATGTTVTRFAYDGQEVYADLNGNYALQTRYLHGDQVDQLFARIAADGTVAWYLTDRLGSVRDLTDGSGVVQDHIDYDGFGNVVFESNPAFGDRYKYTGREFDGETGLQYNRARYYDPMTGRWISQDPLGFAAGDSNLYRYVQNSPMNATDPSGEVPVVPIVAGGLIGWALGKAHLYWQTIKRVEARMKELEQAYYKHLHDPMMARYLQAVLDEGRQLQKEGAVAAGNFGLALKDAQNAVQKP